ncbi:MAG: PKD domain-containing protein [Candidatus Bipolaricaulia bacterium]
MKRQSLVIFLVALLAILLTGCPAAYNRPPIALLTIVSPSPMLAFEVPITVEFDLSGSSDPDGTIKTWSLDYGDGTTDTGTAIPTTPVSHTYEEVGVLTAILTITDNLGLTGKDSVTISTMPATIVFASNRYGSYGIFQMKADGSDEGIVIDTPAADELFPDLVLNTRDKIAYTSNQGDGWNIWKVGVNGFGLLPTKLTTQTPSIQPSWSYDASHIALASKSSGSWEIWRMTASGGSLTMLITQTPSWAIAPACSPVNDDIVFVSGIRNAGVDAHGGSALWLWNGTSASLLYDSPGRDGDPSPAALRGGLSLDLPPDAGISKPAWSPDGEKIAFTKETTGNGLDIYVIDAEGNPLTEINTILNIAANTGADEFDPYWLENGKDIAFVREDLPGKFNIYKVALSNGMVTPLTTSGDNVTPARER